MCSQTAKEDDDRLEQIIKEYDAILMYHYMVFKLVLHQETLGRAKWS